MNEQRVNTTTDVEVRVRRAPRIGIFLVTGGLLGAIGTFVVTSLFETDPEIGFGVLVGYFMIFGVPLGVAVGGVVGLLLDRRSKRRAQLALAERHHVDAPVEADAEADAAASGHSGSEASASEASAPETTAPETSAPRASASEASAPENIAPAASAPESVGPATPAGADPEQPKA